MPLVGVSKCIAYYRSACGGEKRAEATTTVTTSDQEPIVVVEKALLVDYELANRDQLQPACTQLSYSMQSAVAIAAGYGDV